MNVNTIYDNFLPHTPVDCRLVSLPDDPRGIGTRSLQSSTHFGSLEIVFANDIVAS